MFNRKSDCLREASDPRDDFWGRGRGVLHCFCPRAPKTLITPLTARLTAEGCQPAEGNAEMGWASPLQLRPLCIASRWLTSLDRKPRRTQRSFSVQATGHGSEVCYPSYERFILVHQC